MKLANLSLLLTFISILSLTQPKAEYKPGIGNYFSSDIGTPVEQGLNANKILRKTYFIDQIHQIPDNLEIGSYYTTWGIYGGRRYFPHNVPVQRLTHLYIAFGGICGWNPSAHKKGQGLKTACSGIRSSKQSKKYVKHINKLRDGQISFVDDLWGYFSKSLEDDNGNTYNQFQGMMKWKVRNPNLKVIWSLGGWRYSRPFYQMASTKSKRALFINSLVKWLSQKSMGFIDGVDIDWEFPGGLGEDKDVGDPSVDGKNYELLIKQTKKALDKLGKKLNKRFDLTTAIGVGPSQLKNWAQTSKIKDIMPYIDRLGLMTYDFAGSWSKNVGFNSCLKAPKESTQMTNIQLVMTTLRDMHGMTDEMFKKTSLGLNFYGRSHANVPSGLDPSQIPGAPSKDGTGTGTTEAGVFSYYDLYQNYIGPEGQGINGWKTYFYPEYGADILYNSSLQEAIGYLSPRSMKAYAQYVKENHLLGLFSWTIDDDNGFLMQAIHTVLTKDDSSTNEDEKKEEGKEEAEMKQDEKKEEKKQEKKEEKKQEKKEEKKQEKKEENEEKQEIEEEDEEKQEIQEENEEENEEEDEEQEEQENGEKEQELNQEQFNQTTKNYNAGDIVQHNGLKWKALYWTNSLPGSDGSWEHISDQQNPVEWKMSSYYQKPGMFVTWNNKLWTNKYYSHGEEPGKKRYGAWKQVGGSNESEVITKDGAAEWNKNTTYDKTGTFVTWKNKTWSNKYWTKGNEPGASKWGPWKSESGSLLKTQERIRSKVHIN